MAKRTQEELQELEKYWSQTYFRYNEWITLKGEDIFGLSENYPACYVIYKKGVLVYIGQANSLRNRLNNHLSQGIKNGYESPWGDKIEDYHAKVKYPKKYGYEAMLEKRLISRLKPKFNIVGLKKRRKYCWA